MPTEIQPIEYTSDDLDDVMTPEMTEEEAARARPISEAPASLMAALPKNRGGRPRSAAPKVHVSLRIDPEALAAFKATGPGWQALINDVVVEGARRLPARSAAEEIEALDQKARRIASERVSKRRA